MRRLHDAPSFSITNQKFNVIILAAGVGSRLRPETEYIPKALVKVGQTRAIDHFIRKYQYIADRFILAVGYGADLLENYLKGKYPTMNLMFSREDVSELRGPGRSLVYALDHASSRLPTLITFCDYIIDEYLPVDSDILGVCKPIEDASILGTYKTLVVADEGVVVNVVRNEDPTKVKDMGFTGIAVFHNTLLLKMIAYHAAVSGNNAQNVDYTFDIIREYVLRIKTRGCPLSRIFEFGTEDTLKKIRRYFGGSNSVHPK